MTKKSFLRYIDGLWCFVDAKNRSKCLGSAGNPNHSVRVCFIRHGDEVYVQNLDTHLDEDTDVVIRIIPADTIVKGLGESSCFEGKSLSEIFEKDIYYDYNLEPLLEPLLALTE